MEHVVKIVLGINQSIKQEQKNTSYSSSETLVVRIKWNNIIKFSREHNFEPRIPYTAGSIVKV